MGGLPAWVEEVPDITIKDGVFHVALGDNGLRIPPVVFKRMHRRADAAIALWDATHGGVVVLAEARRGNDH
jgi:hypothetical protein